jgi:AraC family transcriptional regulator of adaptative response / DNA-3-methyladenine glycosylase II
VDAVSRLAYAAAHRIGAGALNGRNVAQLARELAVSERHLRRALEREMGVSPVELAQTHRLLLAKRLLADTSLAITQVAYASGFQSLRRFNSVFRERYGMSPSDLRRSPRVSDVRTHATRQPGSPSNDLLRLTLAYRAPLAWDVLTASLGRDATPGVEVVDRVRYARTVKLGDRTGIVIAEDAPASRHVNIDVSASLLPVLMPLLARLRQLFDLDAEPTLVDAHLEQAGLGALVRRRHGVRLPGAFDGFEVACQALLRGSARSIAQSRALAQQVMGALGEPIDTGIPTLNFLAPGAARVADAGAMRLAELGVPRRTADALATLARKVADDSLRLEPGSDVSATRAALMEIDGVSDRIATMIVMRALYWPDAFPASDPALLRAARTSSASQLRAQAERWRPWRAYAAVHLWLHHEES